MTAEENAAHAVAAAAEAACAAVDKMNEDDGGSEAGGGESTTGGGTGGGAMDDEETKNRKRRERLEQNRVSARESRKRKKTMIEELQRTVITLSRENKELNDRNDTLRRQLMDISAKVRGTSWVELVRFKRGGVCGWFFFARVPSFCDWLCEFLTSSSSFFPPVS